MPDLIETGLEPEYTVTNIAWWESTHGGAAVRLCFASRRHGQLIAQYTSVVAISDLVKMIKTAGDVVSRQGGLLAWASEMDGRAH